MTRAPLREAFLVYAGVLVACLVVSALSGGFAIVAEHEQVLVGAIFLVTALELAHRDAGGPERLGLALGGVLAPSEAGPGVLAWAKDLGRAIARALPSALRETGVALALAGVVFPPFALAYRLWFDVPTGFEFEMPPEPIGLVAAQLLAVALPEEAFFRGYLQSRLADAFPARRTILRAQVSVPALFLQAALFAAIHFAFEPLPARLAVFFPALAFGWLRDLRGGIGAALVFHAACNVYADVLWRGFF